MTIKLGRSPRRKAIAGREYPVMIDLAVEDKIRSNLSSLLDELRASTSVSRTDRFKFEYLEREIFSKYLNPKLKNGAKDRETAAVKKWRAAELRNEKTNVRLTCLSADFRVSVKGRPGVVSSDAILATARRFVIDVLGDSPWVGPSGPSIEILRGTFTSGASTKFARGDGITAKKFMDEAHATHHAVKWINLIRRSAEGWCLISDDVRGKPLEIEVVPGSVMFTVPKTSEIDRCAAKEPGLNMFLQKGVGAFIRRRLRSVSRLDLSDQTRNQRLARIGSLGSLATLDLSSASDTISLALVYRLLPLDWFELLNDIRSRSCLVDGELHELSMFSSMGNAFTFELETLIFWALASACAYHLGVRGTISVYGDDIICPVSMAGFLARVFAFVGFKVNPKKSYWAGSFRESCGKHWFSDVDVTPFYVREPIGSIPRLIHFGNSLRKWAGSSGQLDSRFYPLWAEVARLVPRRLRGGYDLDSISQLVSFEKPIDRLLPISREERDVPEAGRYLHWLRAAEDRIESPGVAFSPKGLVFVREALITSRTETVTPRFMVRPAKAEGQHGTLLLWFEEEFPDLTGP